MIDFVIAFDIDIDIDIVFVFVFDGIFEDDVDVGVNSRLRASLAKTMSV